MSSRPPRNTHQAYIDCVRGYAVLMVIACHTAYEFPGLPYAVKRVATSGWFGVQLFFLASCLTMLMSWHAEIARTGRASVPAFFIRRVSRIAPAYYAAAVLYFFLIPPPGGFDPWQAAATAAFVNAWRPEWTPTVADAWSVVPGGWSISVEFAFYAVFPIVAAFVTSLPRAVAVLAASLVVGVVANLAALHALAGMDPVAVDNFLFFWFPNQASVFALGGVLYFIVRDDPAPDRRGGRGGTTMACLAIGSFCLLSYLPLGHYIGGRPFLPAGLVACLPLMVFVLALSRGSRVFVNGLIGFVGKVSFSAYLLHFAVLHAVRAFPGLLNTGATGLAAVLAYVLGFAVAAATTCAFAAVSMRLIEQPAIAAGKALVTAMPRAYEPNPSDSR